MIKPKQIQIRIAILLATLAPTFLCAFSELELDKRPDYIAFREKYVVLLQKQKLKFYNMFNTKEVIEIDVPEYDQHLIFKTKNPKYLYLFKQGKNIHKIDLDREEPTKSYKLDIESINSISSCQDKLLLTSKNQLFEISFSKENIEKKVLSLGEPHIKLISVLPLNDECSSVLVFGEDNFGAEANLVKMTKTRNIINPFKSNIKSSMIGTTRFAVYQPGGPLYIGTNSSSDLDLNEVERKSNSAFKLEGIPYSRYGIGIDKKNTLAVFDIKSKSFSRYVDKQNYVDAVTNSGFNMVGGLIKLANNSGYKLKLFQIPEVGLCQSCPVCDIQKKGHQCLYCGQKDHFWAGKKCIKCTQKDQKDKSSLCSKFSAVEIKESRDFYYSKKNYFDLVFHNGQNFTMNLFKYNFDRILDVSLNGLSKSDYKYWIQKDSGKIRIVIQLISPDKEAASISTLVRVVFKDWELLDYKNEPFMFLRAIEASRFYELNNYYHNILNPNTAKLLGILVKILFTGLLITTFIITILGFFNGVGLTTDAIQLYMSIKGIYFIKFLTSDLGYFLGKLIGRMTNPLSMFKFNPNGPDWSSKSTRLQASGVDSYSIYMIPEKYLLLIFIVLFLVVKRYLDIKLRTDIFQTDDKDLKLVYRKRQWIALNIELLILGFVIQDCFSFTTQDFSLCFFKEKYSFLDYAVGFLASVTFIGLSVYLFRQIRYKTIIRRSKLRALKLSDSFENLAHIKEDNQRISDFGKDEKEEMDQSDVQTRVALKVFMSSLNRSDLTFFTLNFNLLIWIKFCLSAIVIFSLQKMPTLQILFYFIIEFCGFLLVLKTWNVINYKALSIAIGLYSTACMLISINSLFFIKFNTAYKKTLDDSFVLKSIQIFSLLLLLISMILFVYHLVFKFMKGWRERSSVGARYNSDLNREMRKALNDSQVELTMPIDNHDEIFINDATLDGPIRKDSFGVRYSIRSHREAQKNISQA